MSVSIQVIACEVQKQLPLSNSIELISDTGEQGKTMTLRLSQETMSKLISLRSNPMEKKVATKYYLQSESGASIAASLKVSEHKIQRLMKTFRLSLLHAVVSMHGNKDCVAQTGPCGCLK